MKFNITFLGTGQAIPTANRNHVSIFVDAFGKGLLFDCGEGTQRQFRKAHLSLTSIDKIFISHWHGDHVLGLPGIFQTLSMSNYNKTLTVYGPKGSKRNVDELLRVFPHFRKFRVDVIEIDSGVIHDDKNFQVIAEQVKHTIPCFAFSIVEKDQLRIDKAKLKKLKIPNSPIIGQLKQGKDVEFNGKLIKAKSLTSFEKGKKITIIFDTKYCKEAINISKDSDLLICESTYSNDEEALAEEYCHMTAGQAANIAKISKSKKLLLTHFSQRYDHREKILLKQAREVFKNSELTNDLDKIEI